MPYNIDIPGFMSLADLQIIEDWAIKVPANGVIIEVGSFMGRSSWAFAKSADPSVTVYCIDAWENFEIDPQKASVMQGFQKNITYDFEAFKKYIRDCPNIIPLKSKSTKTILTTKKKADLIYIDASHESPDVDEDLDYWFPSLKPKGIFCGHDFDVIKFPDVCRAVINFSEKIDLPITFFKGSTQWAIERPRRYSPPDEKTIISNPFLIGQIKKILQVLYT